MNKLNDTIKRVNCCICDSPYLTKVCTIPDAPIYMGVSDSDDELCLDMSFAKCAVCNTVQIDNLVPQHLLYQANHNTDTVGKTWYGHYSAFAEFITKHCNTSNVIELGDPAAKVARLCPHTSWTIIEPNPSNLEAPSTVKYITGYFSDAGGESYTTAILSHVLEHAFEPKQMLLSVRDALAESGRICISVPNMGHIAKTPQMPPLGMHLEHTFFLDAERLEYLVKASGFEIIELELYQNHSVFICASKASTVLDIASSNFYDAESPLLSGIEHYTCLTSDIQKKVINGHRPIFVYGAHIQTQLLMCLGLDTAKLSGVLDGSTQKHGRRLYGTGLTVFPPETISAHKSPVIICHMGPYTDEIKEALMQINDRC